MYIIQPNKDTPKKCHWKAHKTVFCLTDLLDDVSLQQSPFLLEVKKMNLSYPLEAEKVWMKGTNSKESIMQKVFQYRSLKTHFKMKIYWPLSLHKRFRKPQFLKA